MTANKTKPTRTPRCVPPLSKARTGSCGLDDITGGGLSSTERVLVGLNLLPPPESSG